ncbi:MAG: hypothetical protein GX075_07955, partial [Firmicutes bacterium]|nr:hypothetical protein [Bacillota bacterium]
PVTGILNEGEEAIYLNQAITTVLTREFNRDGSDRPFLLRLLLDYGWERLANDLAGLYRTIRVSGIGLYQAIEMTVDRLNRSGGYSSDDLCGELEDFIEFGLSQKLTPRGNEVLNSFREKWPFYRELLKSEQSLETQVRVLTEIRKALPGNLPNVLKERL